MRVCIDDRQKKAEEKKRGVRCLFARSSIVRDSFLRASA